MLKEVFVTIVKIAFLLLNRYLVMIRYFLLSVFGCRYVGECVVLPSYIKLILPRKGQDILVV